MKIQGLSCNHGILGEYDLPSKIYGVWIVPCVIHSQACYQLGPQQQRARTGWLTQQAHLCSRQDIRDQWEGQAVSLSPCPHMVSSVYMPHSFFSGGGHGSD